MVNKDDLYSDDELDEIVREISPVICGLYLGEYYEKETSCARGSRREGLLVCS